MYTPDASIIHITSTCELVYWLSRQAQRTNSLLSRSINNHIVYTVLMEPPCASALDPVTTGSEIFIKCSEADTKHWGSHLSSQK